ncbi:YjjG family noncanonical pyrimidine nucleotidase [bacterium SCSIO 12741]|nr:YjjG family noncanonical pyrimidine nucleotidase [bacterium SCSIO 12741]
MPIRHLFFDLDRTLWDFRSNSRETLDEIYQVFNLKEAGVSDPMTFIHTYEEVNEYMWHLYRINQLSKEELRYGRFGQALGKLGVRNETLAGEIGDYYIEHSPKKTNLLDHAFPVLDYLKPKYELHIITNGFEEVQKVKLENSGLSHYFGEVITSEMAGCKKPDQRIFEFALKSSGAEASQSVMIGDDLTADIVGARGAGISQVYFNPLEEQHNEQPDWEIGCLSELLEIF